MEREIQLSHISNIAKYASQFSSLGKEYIFSRITNTTPLPKFATAPIRINGVSILLCLSGSIEVDVNLTPNKVDENTLLVVGPNNIINIKHVDGDNLDTYLFVISPEFIRDINLDINVLQNVHISHDAPPSIKLNETEMTLLRRYFDLLHFNTVSNPDDIYARSISRCLIASVFYQLFQFAHKYRKEPDTDEADPRISRRSTYVRDFLNLVHTHFRSERSVGFYASKLFISPKYLSLIIKESTGQSAAEWIDKYVILEAKNLLRFSGKNIQQIAYELNFNNQSSFGKYFKHLTGMSPSKFQRN